MFLCFDGICEAVLSTQEISLSFFEMHPFSVTTVAVTECQFTLEALQD